MLPLPQNDLLEVLVALTSSDDTQIASAATETLKGESVEDLLVAAMHQEFLPPGIVILTGAGDSFCAGADLAVTSASECSSTYAARVRGSSVLRSASSASSSNLCRMAR